MVVRREVPCDGNDMDIVWKIRGNMEGRILLVAFSGTSSEMLLEGMQEDKLFLPSDMQRDGELLTASIAQKSYRYVICFGQKPVLQNKVKIERRALRQENAIYTEFPCDALKQLFEKNGITAELSDRPGCSYCNNVYRKGLEYLYDGKCKTKIVFVHVPEKKNVYDWDEFKECFQQVIRMIGEIE